MIRHIVLYWLKDSTTEGIQKACDTLLSMNGKIPEILSMEAVPDGLHSPRSCDFCLHMTFHSFADLETYKKHPIHLPVQAYMHSVMDHSASADFEI